MSKKARKTRRALSLTIPPAAEEEIGMTIIGREQFGAARTKGNRQDARRTEQPAVGVALLLFLADLKALIESYRMEPRHEDLAFILRDLLQPHRLAFSIGLLDGLCEAERQESDQSHTFP